VQKGKKENKLAELQRRRLAKHLLATRARTAGQRTTVMYLVVKCNGPGAGPSGQAWMVDSGAKAKGVLVPSRKGKHGGHGTGYFLLLVLQGPV
jgi:hypothetical protein